MAPIIQKRFLNSKLLAASILYPSVPRQGGSTPHATQNLGNRSGPARLMARTAAPASVAVKVLMEGNQISPVGNHREKYRVEIPTELVLFAAYCLLQTAYLPADGEAPFHRFVDVAHQFVQ